MSKEAVKRSLRKARKENALGEGAKCAVCGESDLGVPQLVEGRVLCARCRLALQGKEPVERHHPAGRKNDSFTRPMDAVDHAILSDSQVDWPRETLRNPSGNVLRQLAAWLRSAHDTLEHLASLSLNWARTLEGLDRFMAIMLGKDWWGRFKQWLRENPE